MTQLVEEVFVTEGLPELTFVKPPNFNEILLDVRHPGKPVIVEGQSGTGKTTCVRKILEQLPGAAPEYLTARNTVDLHRIEEIARSRPAGQFVIDDFHRLATETQTELANIAKFAAESGIHPEKVKQKLVLIGINQVGSQLIQLVPDLAKRTGIHRIQSGAGPDIETLVREGSNALNASTSQMSLPSIQKAAEITGSPSSSLPNQFAPLTMSWRLSIKEDPAVRPRCRREEER